MSVSAPLQLGLKPRRFAVDGGAASTTTETFMLPGWGIVVDAQDGDTYQLPGYGVVQNRSA